MLQFYRHFPLNLRNYFEVFESGRFDLFFKQKYEPFFTFSLLPTLIYIAYRKIVMN